LLALRQGQGIVGPPPAAVEAPTRMTYEGSSYEGRAGRRRARTPRMVPRSRRNPGCELEASLELADPVEEFAYEHGAGVVEPEVPA
jgi:hypothetical protein